MSSFVIDTKLTTFVYWQVMSYVSYMGAFHLRSLAGNIAGKLGNAFFTLPNSPACDALSVNANIGNAGDTGFAG